MPSGDKPRNPVPWWAWIVAVALILGAGIVVWFCFALLGAVARLQH